jgi:peptidoglycan-associated lipoprotein
MNAWVGRTWVTGLALGFVAVALTGCPKASLPGAGGAGADSGAGALQAGSGLTGGGAAGAGSGSGAQDALAAGAGGGAGATAPGATVFPAQPSVKEFVESAALGDIHFDFDRYTLRPEDARVLDANARWLLANPGTSVLVEGHADERGTNEYNVGLGDARAKATREQLIARGVVPSRITVLSYGEERPLCTERQEACWAKNRRAHFLVKG